MGRGTTSKLAKVNPKNKSFHENKKDKAVTVTIPGRAIGRTIDHIIFNLLVYIFLICYMKNHFIHSSEIRSSYALCALLP